MFALRGKHILVAEDEGLIARDLADCLRSAGARVYGPAKTVREGRALATNERGLDAAILDVDLQGNSIWPVVDILQRSEIPILLLTGFDKHTFPVSKRSIPLCLKPTRVEVVVDRLIRLIDECSSPLNLPKSVGLR